MYISFLARVLQRFIDSSSPFGNSTYFFFSTGFYIVEIPLPSDGFYGFAVAMGRQSAIHTENSGFASPTLGQHISTFRGYWMLFSTRSPYINRFTNHFSIHS
jgi:hypothetical protein